MFHITIKDNEKKEILVDMDTDVIMGVADNKDKCTGLAYIRCSGKTLMQNFLVMQHEARSCFLRAGCGDLLWKAAMSAFLEEIESEKKEGVLK